MADSNTALDVFEEYVLSHSSGGRVGFSRCDSVFGHSGPHRLDVPVVIEIMQAHVGVRMYSSMSIGADVERFEDGKGLGGHAGRGETSVLWPVAPDCVDMSWMPTDDARAPHFAMGSFNESSSRRVGEQMVADIVAHFGEKTKELLSAYKAEVSRHTPLTFDDVEGIWEDEIRPKLAEFASIQPPEPAPPSDSRWYPNSQVPKRRIL